MIERIDIEPPASASGSQETEARARRQMQDAAGKAKEHGANILQSQKNRVASELQAYAAAARKAATKLEEESDLHLSRYFNGAADRLEDFSHRVEARSLNEFWDELETTARRRPEIFYGGMFVVGLAAARFLKASRRKRMRSQFDKASASAQQSFGESQESPPGMPIPVAGFPSGGSPEYGQGKGSAYESNPELSGKPSHG